MKVGTYYVRWRYHSITNGKFTGGISLDVSLANKIDGVTECNILDKDKNVISTGYAYKSVLDAQNNEIGRKTSLARAFYKIKKDENGKDVKDYMYPKEIRTEFWEAYRLLPKTVRWGDTPENHGEKFERKSKQISE